MENGQSFWDFMNHGDGAMWVVLAFSVIALGVAIERGVAQWSFIDRARQLSDQVSRCLARGAMAEARSACERSPSPMADIYLVGYERLGRVMPEHVVTAVHRERQRVNQDLKTRMWVLGTVGATAPFVGLFGTVVGIMSAMNGFKGDVTFEKVAGPISSALIVTAAGIFVAVGAVILFNFFSQRAARIATEMKLLTDEFLELLLEEPKDEKTTPLRKGEADGTREAA
ncbi:MAG TPA: MotA/TolQ/ExbB proton channel family protein [Kofleriaceae bacterium]|jgi:biopolymer transport protein ExbB